MRNNNQCDSQQGLTVENQGLTQRHKKEDRSEKVTDRTKRLDLSGFFNFFKSKKTGEETRTPEMKATLKLVRVRCGLEQCG